MPKLVTRESLEQMLDHPNPHYVIRVIGRALWAIFLRQTKDEQNTDTTKVHNNVGFASCDAKSGSLTAKYWRAHNTLQPWMVDKWTRDYRGKPRICKYHRQLNQIAQEPRQIEKRI